MTKYSSSPLKSKPNPKPVYNLGLDEFFAWCGRELRPGFTKATVAGSREELEARDPLRAEFDLINLNTDLGVLLVAARCGNCALKFGTW